MKTSGNLSLLKDIQNVRKQVGDINMQDVLDKLDKISQILQIAPEELRETFKQINEAIDANKAAIENIKAQSGDYLPNWYNPNGENRDNRASMVNGNNTKITQITPSNISLTEHGKQILTISNTGITLFSNSYNYDNVELWTDDLKKRGYIDGNHLQLEFRNVYGITGEYNNKIEKNFHHIRTTCHNQYLGAINQVDEVKRLYGLNYTENAIVNTQQKINGCPIFKKFITGTVPSNGSIDTGISIRDPKLYINITGGIYWNDGSFYEMGFRQGSNHISAAGGVVNGNMEISTSLTGQKYSFCIEWADE